MTDCTLPSGRRGAYALWGPRPPVLESAFLRWPLVDVGLGGVRAPTSGPQRLAFPLSLDLLTRWLALMCPRTGLCPKRRALALHCHGDSDFLLFFMGPAGVGKTGLATGLLLKTVECSSPSQPAVSRTDTMLPVTRVVAGHSLMNVASAETGMVRVGEWRALALRTRSRKVCGTQVPGATSAHSRGKDHSYMCVTFGEPSTVADGVTREEGQSMVATSHRSPSASSTSTASKVRIPQK